MIFSSYPHISFSLRLSSSYSGFSKRGSPVSSACSCFSYRSCFMRGGVWIFFSCYSDRRSSISSVGRAITASVEKERSSRALLISGLIFNLGLIAWFKYAGLFAVTANGLFGTTLPIPHLFLPLAISFFTFEQISYLVDASRGHAPKYTLLDYSLFVSFFPHLIAGPIIRHNDLIPQFGKDRVRDDRDNDLALGVTLFTMGLAKKTLIADNIAPFSDAVFAAAHQGTFIGLADAWMGTLVSRSRSISDFSGYTDMALGSAANVLGIPAAVQFQLALQGGQHHRILAAVAHLAIHIPARLSLYPAWRQSAWRNAALHQYLHHDAAWRLMARRELDIRDLGRVAWHLSHHQPCVAEFR